MEPYFQDEFSTVYWGDVLDVLRQLPDQSVNCCVTSPPYFQLRDYETGTWDGGDLECDHVKGEMRRGVNLAKSVANTRGGAIKCAKIENLHYGETCEKCGATRIDNQIGLEETPELYIAKMVEVFREVKRVLQDNGTLWINCGDSYNAAGRKGHETRVGFKQGTNRASANGTDHYRPSADNLKPKDMIGIPWMLAFALRADGWFLRQDIIWHKPNPMPESITDRCTKSHEYIFLLSKSERYFYNQEAILEECVTIEEVQWAGHLNGVHSGESHIGEGSTRRFRKGAAHSRGGGLNPKAVAGWASGPGDHSVLTHNSPQNGSDKKLLPRSRQNPSFSAAISKVGVVDKRNKRSVWTVPSEPFAEAHFATFPRELIKPCILAGCPGPGKRCDCQEAIQTPTGESVAEDPSMSVGRAGMERPRGDNGGRRPITRFQQRFYAEWIKTSPHRDLMEVECGTEAFKHYIRTDRAGARPVPQILIDLWTERGWMPLAPEECDCPLFPTGTVLDPFAGSLTTMQVAASMNFKSIGVELNPEYIDIGIRCRLSQSVLNFTQGDEPCSN